MPDDAARIYPEDTPYSIRRETPAQVLLNRIGVTGGLFTVGMIASVLLGRGRRR